MRADLDNDAASFLDQPIDRVQEANGLAQIAPPVVGIEFLALDALTGNGGEEMTPGHLRLDVTQRTQQFLTHRLESGTVEGVVDAQRALKDVAGIQGAGDGRQRLR